MDAHWPNSRRGENERPRAPMTELVCAPSNLLPAQPGSSAVRHDRWCRYLCTCLMRAVDEGGKCVLVCSWDRRSEEAHLNAWALVALPALHRDATPPAAAATMSTYSCPAPRSLVNSARTPISLAAFWLM